jgi:hypothetical protein
MFRFFQSKTSLIKFNQYLLFGSNNSIKIIEKILFYLENIHVNYNRTLEIYEYFRDEVKFIVFIKKFMNETIKNKELLVILLNYWVQYLDMNRNQYLNIEPFIHKLLQSDCYLDIRFVMKLLSNRLIFRYVMTANIWTYIIYRLNDNSLKVSFEMAYGIFSIIKNNNDITMNIYHDKRILVESRLNEIEIQFMKAKNEHLDIICSLLYQLFSNCNIFEITNRILNDENKFLLYLSKINDVNKSNSLSYLCLIKMFLFMKTKNTKICDLILLYESKILTLLKIVNNESQCYFNKQLLELKIKN